MKYLWMITVFAVSLSACDSADPVQSTEFADAQALAASSDAPLQKADDQVLNFTAPLSGRSEVPVPVETRATGVAKFQLKADGSGMTYKLIVSNIENVLMAHIHLAAADQNGPVSVWLYPDSPPPQLIAGRFSGVLAEGEITDANVVGLSGLDELLERMRAGLTYVNVHTTANPPGEIRGQIIAGNGVR